MDIFSSDTQDPAANSDSALLEGVLQKYWRIYQDPLPKLQGHLEQGEKCKHIFCAFFLFVILDLCSESSGFMALLA